MKKNLTTTKLIAIGAMAIMSNLIWFLMGTSLFFASGSIFGALTDFLIGPFLLTFTVCLIDRFGTGTIFQLLAYLLYLPIPSIFPKWLQFFIRPGIGLGADLFYKFFENKRLFSFTTGGWYGLITCLEAIGLYFTVGLPGTENVPAFLITPSGLSIATLIFSVISGLAGYVGFLVYQKLSITAVVRRIQGG